MADQILDESENRYVLFPIKYKSVWDMFWHDDGKWKLSKFNKRSVESLIRIQALESMNMVGPGKLFENSVSDRRISGIARSERDQISTNEFSTGVPVMGIRYRLSISAAACLLFVSGVFKFCASSMIIRSK